MYKECEICFLPFFLHGAWRSIEGSTFLEMAGEELRGKDLLLYDIEPTITREKSMNSRPAMINGKIYLQPP